MTLLLQESHMRISPYYFLLSWDGGARTLDPLINSQMLLPAELRPNKLSSFLTYSGHTNERKQNNMSLNSGGRDSNPRYTAYEAGLVPTPVYPAMTPMGLEPNIPALKGLCPNL